MKKARKTAVVTLLALAALLFASVLLSLIVILDEAKLDLDKFPDPYGTVALLDAEDRKLTRSDYASIEEISKHIQNAFISVEDKRFYKHNGIDPIRIGSALWNDLKKGYFAQGGSTITCQLVKNTQLNGEKTLKRKLQEAKLALEIEQKYDKSEILEMYLNVIYFGKGIYGVKNACRAFFDKSPADVSPIEAASLAATVANPSKYNPIASPKQNHSRAEMVLTLMQEQGFLSEEEYQREIHSDIIISCGDFHNNYYDFYAKMALFEAEELIKSLGAKPPQPLIVYTYYEARAQESATSALHTATADIDHSSEILLAENDSGGILAYASNSNIGNGKRQPGSLMKPFIYATAIDRGIIIPDSQINDRPTDFNGYHPANYANTYYGWISAKTALSRSVNTASVSILQKVGVDEAFSRIERCGIPLSPQDKNLALALGGTTYGSSAREICNGYLALANNGYARKATFIRKICDAKGKILYQNTPTQTSVFSQETAYLVTDMLTECARNGTAKQLAYLPFTVAAKTGTVAAGEGNADAWCAGYTVNHTFVCHISSVNNATPLANNITGGNQPTKCARALLRMLYKDVPPPSFPVPKGIKYATVDKTICEELHKLVLHKETNIGEKMSVLTTSRFRFDSVDPDEVFLSGLDVKTDKKQAILTFRKREGIHYEVTLNDKACEETSEGFLLKKPRFPLIKIEIKCKKGTKTLYKKSKILRLDQMRMSSIPPIASSISNS